MTKRLKQPKLQEIAKRDLKRDLLFHVPSALIIFFYSTDWLYEKVIAALENHESLYAFLKDYQIWFHIPLIFFAIGLPLINKYYSSLQIVLTGSEDLRIRITEILNKAVNQKESRFREILKLKKANNSIEKDEIFEKITQPIYQIQILSENILALIRHVCDSNEIKLTVIICENNQLQNFVFHSDHQPKVTIDQLTNNKSIARKTLEGRKSQLVSEIKDINTDYYKGLSNIKSIYCFPVSKSSEVNFILSFSSPMANDLKNDKKEFYDEILSEFENRFMLEWHLNSLKK